MNKLLNVTNQIIVYLLLSLFPLNQQLHLKPFPSVDGFIIDYLMVKISIPETLLFVFLLLNIKVLLRTFLNLNLKQKILLIIPFLFLSISTIKSSYLNLAIYENFVIFSIILFLISFKDYLLSFSEIFIKSLKVWLILLLSLGVFQFVYQSSVLGNYYIFGEFPYTEDHFHVKQKNMFFENLIPPYGIFSHSNIFGGYILFVILILRFFKKDEFWCHIASLIVFCLVGSLTVFLGYLLLVTLTLLKSHSFVFKRSSFFIYVSILVFVNTLLTLDIQKYQNDFSVYRRVYMVDISVKEFFRNPSNFLFGFGYFNYFSVVKDRLYDYELVRFFQPVHNSYFWIIWQYGFVFLIFIFFILFVYWKKINNFQIIFLYVISTVGFLDHYVVTNHQLKILFMLFLTYSLTAKNNVKLSNVKNEKHTL